MRQLILCVGLLWLAACGKNDPYANSYAGGPFAPVPPNGGYPAPSGFPQVSYPYTTYPTSCQGSYCGTFNPTGYTGYPGGSYYPGSSYPNQMTPWLPLTYWMNQDYYRRQYYSQFMAGWYQYAQMRGWSPYYFNGFWLDYARRYWAGTSYDSVYRYYSAYVYPWVTWQTQFPSYYSSPVQYWQGYIGLPLIVLDTWFPVGMDWGSFSL